MDAVDASAHFERGTDGQYSFLSKHICYRSVAVTLSR